ncbi:spore germination protein GerPE [Gracilibacillus sp. YIM 98692]|uniref:spore germination protein GerPE n=1 Tax=Gracilibacillus sp. YIM 98692 TaxID=2663532 RepID=UPI0013D011C1|nr:spore germination protein GerPE [Gracilibacillus sp. YIM 98692]
MKQHRTAKVNAIKVTGLSRSSIFHIGDVHTIEPELDALAVQKEGGISSDKGFELEKFPIFQREFIHLSEQDDVIQTTTHHHPFIRTNKMNIMAASASAILQIGNSKQVNAEAKVKHIRIIKEEENSP